MKESVVAEKLYKMAKDVRKIRDDQEEIPCGDGDKGEECMCHRFDYITDLLEELAADFDDAFEGAVSSDD